jgi:hypothetical protein
MPRACVLEHQGSWDQNLPWIEPREKDIFGPDLVEEAKATVHCIYDNLKSMKSRQETYAKKRCRPLVFKGGEHGYFRVSPIKGVKRFGVIGKLAPHYTRPFPILGKCETVAYKLDLPLSSAGVHNIFDMSQLKKCLKAPVDVMFPEVTPLKANLWYLEHPIKVLDQKDCVTRRQTIKFFKIQWGNHSEEEATWQSEDFLRSHHLDLLLP